MRKKLTKKQQLEKKYNVTITEIDRDGFHCYQYESNLPEDDLKYIFNDYDWLVDMEDIEQDIRDQLKEN